LGAMSAGTPRTEAGGRLVNWSMAILLELGLFPALGGL
jgi:hypothetical protein